MLTSLILKVIKFSQHICSNLLTVCQAWNEYLPYIKISAFLTSINDVTTSRIKSAATFIKSELSVSANMQNSSIIFTSIKNRYSALTQWLGPRFRERLKMTFSTTYQAVDSFHLKYFENNIQKTFVGLLLPFIADNCFLPRQ